MRKILYYEKDISINGFKLLDYGYIQTKDKVNCICKLCNNTFSIILNDLKNGNTQSCGCAKSKYGELPHKKRLYSIYSSIKKRCNNPNHTGYKNYGGRGIKNKWGNFQDFYNDMSKSYIEHYKEFGEKETTIDRIDVNGNYCKENCKWATQLEQQSNKRSRNIRWITYNGETHTQGGWIKILGLTR